VELGHLTGFVEVELFWIWRLRPNRLLCLPAAHALGHELHCLLQFRYFPV
jgi:hypothetical protein